MRLGRAGPGGRRSRLAARCAAGRRGLARSHPLPLSAAAIAGALVLFCIPEAALSPTAWVLAGDICRSRSSGGGAATIWRRAAGFNYGKLKGSGKGFDVDANAQGSAASKKDKGNKGSAEEETSSGLVKDEREGKSKAISRTKLRDLRDKTLALRQKREAELDEYEEGRALIAKYGPKVGIMPQKVASRVAKRGMVIGGSFYGVMLAVFALGILLFKTQELIIPPTLMAFITLALLALAIAGSSYGMMSASWDPDSEGSLLGTEEFGDNVKAIGEGFRRLTMQEEYDKAIQLRRERKKLLEAKEDKKRELLNK